MRRVIANAKLILPDRIAPGYVAVDGGKISEIRFGAYAGPEPAIDAKGLYLSPGFVDIHAHGGGGSDFMDATAEAFEAVSRTHLTHGTTALLATTVAASAEATEWCIDRYVEMMITPEKAPNLIGLHMEGPYLNAEYKGAIDERYIVPPNPTQCREWIERAEGHIRRWTIAPELDGALGLGEWLASRGVLPSIGHSAAEYSRVLEAFRAGYTHITHLYSAVSTIVRRSGFRYPGVLESAYIIEGMTAEVIADGCHLPEELLRLVCRAKGPDRVCLVCDSMRCAGADSEAAVLGDERDGRRVIIEDGVAKLPDRSAFAGSIATDDRLVRVMVKAVGTPLLEAVRMMSLTPARIIGADLRKGSIEIGKDADLILFDDEIRIDRVMVGGKFVD